MNRGYTCLPALVLLLAGLILAAPVLDKQLAAQTKEVKLKPSRNVENHTFGAGVAISGNYAIVGGWGVDASSGAAYIYKREAAGWNEVAYLTSGETGQQGHFGWSVAIHENQAIVGARTVDNRGAAYIYQLVDGEWTFAAKLTADDPDIADRFGSSVDIYDDYAVVGNEFASIGTSVSQGAAYVFKRDAGMGWGQVAKLVGDDSEQSDNFGVAVSIEGEWIMVGTHNHGDGFEGAAYVFRRENDIWQQTAKLMPSDLEPGDSYGISMDIAGDRAIIGAVNGHGMEAGSGVAYVYRLQNDVWLQEARIYAAAGINGEQFGNSVAISGNSIVVGAWSKQIGSSTYQGGAYLFRYEQDTWNETGIVTASDGAEADEFGWAVAADGAHFIIGAPEEAEGDFQTGAAYIYTNTAVGVGDARTGDQAIHIFPARPNPTSGSTAFKVELLRPADIGLDIYALNGEKLLHIPGQLLPAGQHALEWKAQDTRGVRVAAGIYYAVFTINGSAGKTMSILLR